MEQRSRAVKKQQIKTYVCVLPSGGIDPILANEYEILGNKISSMNRWNHHKYNAHTFNFIFNQEFDFRKQLEHMNIIDDCLEGIDQVVFVDIHKQFTRHFMLGTPEEPGFILAVFYHLFNQTFFTKQANQSAKSSHTHKKQTITISVFSTEGTTNKFIDLIVGQKHIFYSKKDMDEYKDFFSKEIKSLREFLILLKIVFLRYAECCKEGDPIVFKIGVDSYDEVKNCNYSSKIHIVVYETNSKIQAEILRKIDFSLKSAQLKGEDHGSLANYLDRFLRKNKLVYVYGIPFRKSVLENSEAMFCSLMKLKNYSIQVQNSIVWVSPSEKLEKLNNFRLPVFNSTSHEFTHRDISLANKLLERLCDFLSQTQTKWKNYCLALSEILQISADFYERQRFPISLQIQEFNVKSFLISKIYRLSETYQMEDLSHLMEKLRTIKNQITIAFKALQNSKQLSNLAANLHMYNFLNYYHQCNALISNNIKMLFGFNYRCVQTYDIKLAESVNIEVVMDGKVLRALMARLKNEAKVQEKDQVLLRRVDLEPLTENVRITDRNHRNNSLEQSERVFIQKQALGGSKIFEYFKKARRNKNRSNLTEGSTLVTKSKDPSRFADHILKQSGWNGNDIQNSIIITKEPELDKGKYFLPQIAIIHRKKGCR